MATLPASSVLNWSVRVAALVVAVGVGSWLVVQSQREAQPRTEVRPPPEPKVVPTSPAATGTPEASSPVAVENPARAGRESETPAPPRPVTAELPDVGQPAGAFEPEPVLFHSSKAMMPPLHRREPPDAGPKAEEAPRVFIPSSKMPDPSLFDRVLNAPEPANAADPNSPSPNVPQQNIPPQQK